ncbi:unnamed protein product, partial [Eretmochelys imbricata]
WKEYAPGWLRCLDVASVDELDSNNKSSVTKTTIFMLRTIKTGSWEKLKDIQKIFWCNKNPTSALAGRCFLRKCTSLPENFPVMEELVAGSLGEGTTLRDELKKGNIFLTDYKILEGIPTTQLKGEQQYLAVPLCLLH